MNKYSGIIDYTMSYNHTYSIRYNNLILKNIRLNIRIQILYSSIFIIKTYPHIFLISE